MEKTKILKDLADFVSIASVSDDQEKVRKALDYILDLGDTMGFRVQRCADGQVGVIEMGDGDETLGILAHVDVVPAGDLAQWESGPFEAVIRDGKIFGRGTLDDKGMIIASLYAMKAVMDSGKPLYKKVQLILGTQEEVEWTDMDAYVKSYPLPDYGFSPDGEYPICNIEKGVADFTLEFDVTEDLAEGEVPYVTEIHCGTATNSVPGKAQAFLSDGRMVTAEGKTVHSCQPERGDNALFNLCRKLEDVGAAENKLMRLLQAVKDGFEDVYGSGIGLRSEDEYYKGEFVHRNTFSPTIFKAQGGKVTVNINCRFPYGASEDALKDGITAFAAANGGSITAWDILPAVFVSQHRPFLQVLAGAYEEVTGLQNEFTLAYGGSYAKAMPGVVSWGPIFPGEEDTCHEANEYISVDSLMKSTEIFTRAIEGIVCSEESMK